MGDNLKEFFQSGKGHGDYGLRDKYTSKRRNLIVRAIRQQKI